MFNFDLSDDLKLKIKKLIKKDKKKVEIINKKIREVINNDLESINHYKNLRYDLKEFYQYRMDLVLQYSIPQYAHLQYYQLKSFCPWYYNYHHIL